MIKIMIAEDQGMILGALAALLDLEEDISVIKTAENGKVALSFIQDDASVQPEILVTDIEMPKMTGLELASAVAELGLGIKVIILTTFSRAGYLRRAMDSGVKGYLLKDSPSDELVMAIRKVHSGGKVIAPELLQEAWALLRRCQIRKSGTPQGALQCGSNNIPVCENSPLGQTGGAAGELDQGRVVREYVNPGQACAGSIFQ